MARILIADDAPFIRAWCRAVLTRQGHEVLEANDGAAAETTYLEQRPDLVLLDVLMPVVDGLAALQRIKAADPAARVLVLTTEARLDVVDQARELGALDFVLKPCAAETFVERVNRALA